MRKIILKQHKSSVIGAVGIGVALSLLIILLGGICLTSMVLNGMLEDSGVSFCVCILLGVAAGVGSLVSTIAKGDRLAITCLLMGVFLVAILLSVSIIFFDGIEGELSKYVALVLGIITGCTCNLLTVKRRKTASHIC